MFIYENLIQLIIQQTISSPLAFPAIYSMVMFKLNSFLNGKNNV